MSDQRPQPQTLRLLAGDQHAVGAVVRDQAGARCGCFRLLARPLVQCVDDAHDLGGARILQPHDVDFLVAAQVDALDDAHHAADVAGAVRDDQHVRGRIRDQVAVLRDQRPQHRHELRGAHVAHADDLRDEFVGAAVDPLRQVFLARPLTRVGVRNDLDGVAGRYRDEAVHLQDRQERLVEGFRRHRRRGQDRYLRAHARIDDEGLTRDLADCLDDLREVGVAECRRDRRLLLTLRRLLRRRGSPGQRARDRERSQARAVAVVLEDRHGRSLLSWAGA